ncbi:MAG TPA: hypothetical protein P5191_08450 [Ruminococcus sp.]|nr:hypothetical protein [Ruminococcus sp.]
MKKISKSIALISALSILCGSAAGCGSSDDRSSSSKIKTSNVDLNGDVGSTKEASEDDEKVQETTEKETEPTTEAPTEAPTEPPTEAPTEPETYEANSHFDVIQRGEFENIIGYTKIIDKVAAKKTGSVTATVIAKSPDGAVIGKSYDTIYLVEGENNNFSYSFEEDVSNAVFDITIKQKDDYMKHGEPDAIEMSDWNISGDHLYITINQMKEDLGAFTEYKILFLKGGQIVDAEEGYLDIHADNLDGVGSTDVIEVWVYGEDFDDIEFIYEP